MSRNYDNWERLVAAVLRREQFRELCRSDSLDSSLSSFSSDFASASLSRRTSFDISINHQTEQIPHPTPPRNPYISGGGVVTGAELEFVAPEKVLAWSQRALLFATPAKLRARSQKRKLLNILVTGVPKLKRYELEIACEDFANIVIGSSSTCLLFKGTLSSGVEIVVAYVPVASSKHWSNSLEAQFRKKIVTLSNVNHKNFVNMLGYCVEENPFTRMMVFEYAPNGTLFECLHIKEGEYLNWEMRLRIAMGIAYCLEHMHQLRPAIAHRNLNSSAVYLTEDYAAKLSDFLYWDEVATAKMEANPQSNVYSFGIILFEMITGSIPYSDNWLSDYPRGVQSLREMIDPTLETYHEDQLEQIGSVIKSCSNPDWRKRPTMREVCALLREITEIEPDGAIPDL
ncbi:hypothetical protein BUALT_Bualt06G0096300 [Buddleja alternifolia]|uniref:Protein kinase domain-containing protein n=1 Tax=Buddleja alternifolia TaxID=168488 RepID=A0AAV6XPY2_9LAMI|nr:hypothetical protein BUALT_Bualt06G0096300 [Buddleja alternifolia]